MGFEQGKKKTGGRKKGVPNKTTDELRQMVTMILDKNMERLQEDIDQLDPKDRVKTVLDLLKFAIPTLKAVDLTNDSKGVNQIEIIVTDYKSPD